jgi:predicted nucleic acid-binding protein
VVKPTRMKLYFDACCLNRLTDDQRQERIRREAEAMEKLMGFVADQRAVWVSSQVLIAEIARNPNAERREDALNLLSFAGEVIPTGADILQRARVLEALGFSGFDALHLACAESAHVDAFLTTDDRLLRRAQRGVGSVAVRVSNPLSFLEEVL